MGTLSWDDLTPITAVTKKVLEDAGYTVKLTSFALLALGLNQLIGLIWHPPIAPRIAFQGKSL